MFVVLPGLTCEKLSIPVFSTYILPGFFPSLGKMLMFADSCWLVSDCFANLSAAYYMVDGAIVGASAFSVMNQ